MKVVCSGGGTLGPVTPLLAITDTLKEMDPATELVWIGTKKGPERGLIEARGIRFQTIASGKLRRYLSVWNITDIVRIVVGFVQSLVFLWRENPTICISAGGFISVPVHWAAWLLGIPTWIHQQDVRVGLANRLMAPTATRITTALEQSVSLFPKKKTIWLGNPVRKEIRAGSREHGIARFQLDPAVPVVFATGGGTGSMRVNQLIVQAVQHLETHAQVIHLTGKERPQELVNRAVKHFDYYQIHQFFTEEMPDAYAAADIVISRGGFGTITELAALGKCAILIPKPGHQVENVAFLKKAGAIVLVNEQTSDGNSLAGEIKALLADTQQRAEMGQRLQRLLPPAKDESIKVIVQQLLGK